MTPQREPDNSLVLTLSELAVIECGLDSLDLTVDRPGMILILYAPDPEPEGRASDSDGRATQDR